MCTTARKISSRCRRAACQAPGVDEPGQAADVADQAPTSRPSSRSGGSFQPSPAHQVAASAGALGGRVHLGVAGDGKGRRDHLGGGGGRPCQSVLHPRWTARASTPGAHRLFTLKRDRPGRAKEPVNHGGSGGLKPPSTSRGGPARTPAPSAVGTVWGQTPAADRPGADLVLRSEPVPPTAPTCGPSRATPSGSTPAALELPGARWLVPSPGAHLTGWRRRAGQQRRDYGRPARLPAATTPVPLVAGNGGLAGVASGRAGHPIGATLTAQR